MHSQRGGNTTDLSRNKQFWDWFWSQLTDGFPGVCRVPCGADYCRAVIRGWVMMGKWSGNFSNVTRSQYFNIFLPGSKVTKLCKNYSQADANGWPYQDLLAEIYWKFLFYSELCALFSSRDPPMKCLVLIRYLFSKLCLAAGWWIM